MSLQDDTQKMQAAGFSSQEIQDWTDKRGASLLNAGFSQQEVQQYMGIKDPNATDIPEVRDMVRSNLAQQPKDQPLSLSQAVQAGLESSVTGLALRGKLPDVAMTGQEGTLARAANTAAQMAGDAPAAVGGFFAGGAAGAETGPGALVTGMGGAFALPSALRATLIDAYSRGDFKNFGDFWNRATQIAMEEAKGWLTGTATAVAGIGAGAATVAAPWVVQAAATLGAQDVAMTSTGSALNGRMPTAQSFVDNGIVLLGMHGAMEGSAALRDVFSKTGIPPERVVAEAQGNPAVAQQMASANTDAPKAYGETQQTPITEYPTERGPIPAAKDLSPPQRAIEQNFAGQLGKGFEQAAKEYAANPDSQGGKVLNTDLARELSPDYLGDRTQSAAVHEPASWFVKQLYQEKLAEPPAPGEDNSVLFTAGGTGAGKTSAIKQLGGEGSPQIIYDTNMNNFDSSKEKIDQALAAGKTVNLLYVYREPVDALVNGALPRAMRQEGEFGSGRTVPIDEHADAHIGSLSTIKQLAETYKGDDRVNIGIIDNSRGKGQAVEIPIDKLPNPDYNGLHEKLSQAVEDEFGKGNISDSVRAGFTGRTKAGSDGIAAGEPQPQRASGNADQLKILSKISSSGAVERQGLSWDKFYTSVVDKLDPIRRMTQAMQASDDQSAIQDSYKLMRLLPGAGGKAEQFLEHGTFDFNTLENTGKSLKAALAPVKNDLNGFRAYAAASRALELEGRSIKSGMDVDAAKAVVSDGKEQYSPVFKDLQDYQTATLKYLRDAGVLSSDGFDAMKNLNKSYVPFYRVMDEGEGFGIGMRSKNPIKAIKGSERNIIDPVESVIRNTFAYTQLAERNAAVKAFFDQASKEADPSQYFEKTPATVRPISVSGEEIARFLKGQGIEGTPDAAMTIFRAMRTPLAKDEVGYLDNGKWQVMKVDPDLAEAFNGTPRPAQGLLFSLLRAPAALLRAGLVTPEFIIRHFERNQLSASALAPKGNIPFWDTFKGMISYLGKDEDYQNWLKSGAQIGAPSAMDHDAIQDEMRSLTGEKPDQGIAGTVWNLAKTPFDVMHAIQQSLEGATRLGSFKRAISGLDVTKDNLTEAGYASRNIAPDPSRIGSATANWNAITALFNTEIQHTDQLVSALRDRPIGTLAKIFAGVTLPSVLLWAHNHDTDEWKEAHQWERDFFWLVPTGGFTLRIPKPFLLGELFGSGVERMLDKISGADTDNRGIKHFLSDFAEWGVPNFMPTALAPVLEQTTNYSFFKGSQLVPDHLMQMLPEYRYSEYTSELTKALGRIVGSVPYVGQTSMASPIVLDNYLYKWTGGLGTYALSIADAALRKSGVLPDPPLPASTLADIPVVKGFVVRYPSSTADSIEKFEEDYQKRSEVTNTFKALMKQGDPVAAQQVMQSNPAAMAKLDSVNKAITEQNQLVRLVYKNPGIPAEEKRQIIDSTYFNMINMAKAGNQLMQALDESVVSQTK